MKQTLKHIYQTFCLSLAVTIVLLAVLLTLARAVTPLLGDHREAVEHWASNLLHQPVKINQIAVTWHGFTPILIGHQVVIFNDTNTLPLFKVNELKIGVDIFSSLMSRKLQLGIVSVEGAELTIQQMADGGIHINGVNNSLPASLEANVVTDVDEFINWLASEPKVILKNINVVWHDQNGKRLQFKALNINLHNDGKNHKLAGEAALVQKMPSSIQFVLDLKGNWHDRNKIKASLYVNAHNLFLQQWLEKYTWQGYKVLEGKGDFQVWANWQDDHFNLVQSLFSLNELKLSISNTKQIFVLHSLISNLYWQKDKNKPWILDINFTNLIFDRWRGLPGFNGLAGYMHMTPDSGVMELNSKITHIDFGPLFKAPLHFAELAGHFNWQSDPTGWMIQGKNVSADNADLTLIGDFGLWLPVDNSGAVMSLLAKAKSGINGAKNLSSYLPLTILKPDLVQWLTQSILNVKAATGTLALRGRLTDFPFDEGTGTFLIDVNVQDGTLDYWPGWPVLKHADANLIFSGRTMAIDLIAGQILAAPLQHIQVGIPLLKKEVQALLNIHGQVNADLAQGIQFLQQSPLRTKVGSSLKGVGLKGPMQLQLDAEVPIEKGPSTLKVQGKILTNSGELLIPERDMHLTGLIGALEFTHNEINASSLKGMLWDKPISMSISSKPQLKLQLDYLDTPLTLLQQSRGWLLKINNPNILGAVLIPRYKSQPLEANFNYLYFDPDKKDEFAKWQVEKIPAVNFLARKIRFGNKQFGQVQFRLRPILNGIAITNLNAVTNGSGISANGWWKNNSTELNGVLTTSNIATFLSSLSLPAGIAGAGKIEFRLRWPDAPYAPAFKWMNGNVVLKFKQGQIVDIGADAAAKMGFGRLLTSLSFQSLGRHFTSQPAVSSQGFEFDIMEGNLLLKNGNAYTTNLFLDGPVAQINLLGRIGLVNQDYDLTLKVVPHVTASLPIIAGLAGGPIVGAVAWMANKVLGSEVQKIAASNYRVTGSWKQPVVKPM